MSEAVVARPPCADASAAAGEPLAATASRVGHWLLVEYTGHWPYEPLDAAPFVGRLREHLANQLAALPHSRLFLVKRSGRARSDGVRVVYGRTPERGARFYELEVESHADLLDVDVVGALAAREPLGRPLEQPLLLVCTHGKRDRCCAQHGQPLCRALHARLPGAWLWQSSHVGGDRFAGNVVALPEGLYFGRVRPGDVPALVARYREGRLALDLYRGRSCYPFYVQAAEVAVRRATGLDGLCDLRVTATRRLAEDTWRVELVAEVAGDVHAVEVRAERGEEAFLTCRTERPRRPRRFVASAHRVERGEPR